MRFFLDPRTFPTALMVLDLCAAVVFFYHGDVKRGIYWASAATLTWCVIP